MNRNDTYSWLSMIYCPNDFSQLSRNNETHKRVIAFCDDKKYGADKRHKTN